MNVVSFLARASPWSIMDDESRLCSLFFLILLKIRNRFETENRHFLFSLFNFHRFIVSYYSTKLAGKECVCSIDSAI